MTNNQPAPPANIKFIDGTSSTQSYAVIARRGDIVLGLKLNGLHDGKLMHMSGKTYLSARVRSARAPGLFADEEGSNVVQLGEQTLTLAEAWPNLAFDKVSEDRASCGVGLFIRGSLATDPEVVRARIDEQDFLGKLLAYVAEKAGEENVVVQPRPLLNWWKQLLAPAFAEAAVMAATNKEFQQQLEANVEVVGLHAQQLKAIYEKNAAMQEALHASQAGKEGRRRGRGRGGGGRGSGWRP